MSIAEVDGFNQTDILDNTTIVHGISELTWLNVTNNSQSPLIIPSINETNTFQVLLNTVSEHK